MRSSSATWLDWHKYWVILCRTQFEKTTLRQTALVVTLASRVRHCSLAIQFMDNVLAGKQPDLLPHNSAIWAI
jgi:hypothetical protein